MGRPQPPHVRVAAIRELQGQVVTTLVLLELALCLLLLTDLPQFDPTDTMASWGAMHVYPIVGSVSLGLQAVCGALWCRWSVAVARALRSLRVDGMRHDPRYLGVWWLIPGLNLVRPYATMVELWKASVGAARRSPSWTELPTRPWLLVWWTLWVVHLLAMPLALVAAELVEAKPLADGLFLLGMTLRHATMLAATPLAIALLRQIGRNLARAVELQPSQSD